jgi:hypothetical protein
MLYPYIDGLFQFLKIYVFKWIFTEHIGTLFLAICCYRRSRDDSESGEDLQVPHQHYAFYIGDTVDCPCSISGFSTWGFGTPRDNWPAGSPRELLLRTLSPGVPRLPSWGSNPTPLDSWAEGAGQWRNNGAWGGVPVLTWVTSPALLRHREVAGLYSCPTTSHELQMDLFLLSYCLSCVFLKNGLSLGPKLTPRPLSLSSPLGFKAFFTVPKSCRWLNTVLWDSRSTVSPGPHDLPSTCQCGLDN